MPMHSAACYRWRPISRQALSHTLSREATDGNRGSASKPKPTCRNRTAAVCPLWRGAASSSQPRLGHLVRSRHDAWGHTGSYELPTGLGKCSCLAFSTTKPQEQLLIECRKEYFCQAFADRRKNFHDVLSLGESSE